MCGIVGVLSVSGSVGVADRRMFMEQGLFVGTLRGKDGTGLFHVKHTVGAESAPCASWVKQTAIGPTFIQEPKVKAVFNDMLNTFAVIGHNRAATMGTITNDNTHPFSEGDITLVHNGTLFSHSDLPKAKNTNDVEVDSHAIAHALAVSSVDEVIENLEGAFALVWYDKRDGTVNLVRNNKRPLHLGIASGGRTIYIASELDMIKWITARNNIHITDYVQPAPGALLSWNSTKDHLTPTMRTLKLAPIAPATTRYYGDGHFANFGYGGWRGFAEAEARNTKTYTDAIATEQKKQEALSHLPQVGADNKVRVRGAAIQKEINVPTAMQLALEDVALTINDRMLFLPTSIIREGSNVAKTAVIGGLVGDAMVRARVYSMNKNLIRPINACMQWWEVAPIGVSVIGKNELEIICRVVDIIDDPEEFEPQYTIEEEAMYLYEDVGHNAGVSNKRKDTDDTDTADETAVAGPLSGILVDPDEEDAEFTNIDRLLNFPGPMGSTVSRGRFLELTQDGCHDCGMAIMLAEAWEAVWKRTQSGVSAILCKQCKEEQEEAALNEYNIDTAAALRLQRA